MARPWVPRPARARCPEQNSRAPALFCCRFGAPGCPSSASGGPVLEPAVLPISTARRLRAFTYAEPAATNLNFGPSCNGALQAEHCGGGCHEKCAGNDDPYHLGAVGGDEPRLLANRAAIATHEEHEERQGAGGCCRRSDPGKKGRKGRSRHLQTEETVDVRRNLGCPDPHDQKGMACRLRAQRARLSRRFRPLADKRRPRRADQQQLWPQLGFDCPALASITAFKSASVAARRLRPSNTAPCSMAKDM